MWLGSGPKCGAKVAHELRCVCVCVCCRGFQARSWTTSGAIGANICGRCFGTGVLAHRRRRWNRRSSSSADVADFRPPPRRPRHSPQSTHPPRARRSGPPDRSQHMRPLQAARRGAAARAGVRGHSRRHLLQLPLRLAGRLRSDLGHHLGTLVALGWRRPNSGGASGHAGRLSAESGPHLSSSGPILAAIDPINIGGIRTRSSRIWANLMAEINITWADFGRIWSASARTREMSGRIPLNLGWRCPHSAGLCPQSASCVPVACGFTFRIWSELAQRRPNLGRLRPSLGR